MADFYTQQLDDLLSRIPGATASQTGKANPISPVQGGKVLSPTDFTRQAFGDVLSPGKSFTDQLSYQGFTQPFEEYVGGAFEEFARPEFERDVLNPFTRALGSQSLASGGFRFGGAPESFERQVRPVRQQFAQQRADLIEGMLQPILRQEYARLAEQSAMSPLNLRNF